jgi:DNA-binding CsgD family transcriptional regulator
MAQTALPTEPLGAVARHSLAETDAPDLEITAQGLTLGCTMARAALGVFVGGLVPGENAMQVLGPRTRAVLLPGRGGASVSALARALFLSGSTVRNDLSPPRSAKTGAANRAEAVAMADSNGRL